MNIIWPSYYFLFVAVTLVASLLAYLKLAQRFSLFDTPNERSSHSTVTIRGGGVLFLIAILLYLGLSGGKYPVILLSALTLGLISFVDDMKDLSAKLRLGLHFALILILIHSLGLLSLNWLLPILVLFSLWLMNAYNFMDGINGITFSNTFSHLLALSWASHQVGFLDRNLLITLLIATLVFGFFNFRKRAVCFLGDVGSIPLGFMLIAFTLMLMLATESLDPLVFFALYMLDSGWTIAQRLLNKENILKPHRKHLYQVLANEYNFGHLPVSAIFFFLQMSINLGYFMLNDKLLENWYFFLVMGIGSMLYVALKVGLVKRIPKD